MDLLDKLWKKGKDFLGVEYPILCGAMTWVSTFELVKAVSDNGAFGILAGGNMPPEIFEQEVDKCIANIKKPFAVNLITIAPNFKTQYEILKKKDVPFVVFAGNFPKREDVVGMKDAGKKTLAFASNDTSAHQQIRFGIDALVLEGNEAGGHIGYVTLMILLQQVLFKFNEVPIFVAGGIGTGRMMANLLLMGAAGVQLGTRFVLTEECKVHPSFKKAFIRAHARHAIAAPQYDPRIPVVAVRSIKNKGTEEFGRIQLELIRKLEEHKVTKEEAQFEVESFWIGALKKAAIDGDVEHGSLMAGQSVGLFHDVKPIKQVLNDLMTEARGEIDRIKNIVNS
ncbi:MAG: hypothetical protein A2Y33_15360 [Spirochaetes bacterium GWF1_51_8]|nr:MAG: hypothetical protein A2Y33_15360 [Spirochaetes bacterium GWF1_51_8]